MVLAQHPVIEMRPDMQGSKGHNLTGATAGEIPDQLKMNVLTAISLENYFILVLSWISRPSSVMPPHLGQTQAASSQELGPS